MTKYKCIKKLALPELEEYNGMATGNEFVVEVGEVFLAEGDETDFLEKEDGSRWLQIEDDILDGHFERLED